MSRSKRRKVEKEGLHLTKEQLIENLRLVQSESWETRTVQASQECFDLKVEGFNPVDHLITKLDEVKESEDPTEYLVEWVLKGFEEENKIRDRAASLCVDASNNAKTRGALDRLEGPLKEVANLRRKQISLIEVLKAASLGSVRKLGRVEAGAVKSLGALKGHISKISKARKKSQAGGGSSRSQLSSREYDPAAALKIWGSGGACPKTTDEIEEERVAAEKLAQINASISAFKATISDAVRQFQGEGLDQDKFKDTAPVQISGMKGLEVSNQEIFDCVKVENFTWDDSWTDERKSKVQGYFNMFLEDNGLSKPVQLAVPEEVPAGGFEAEDGVAAAAEAVDFEESDEEVGAAAAATAADDGGFDVDGIAGLEKGAVPPGGCLADEHPLGNRQLSVVGVVANAVQEIQSEWDNLLDGHAVEQPRSVGVNESTDEDLHYSSSSDQTVCSLDQLGGMIGKNHALGHSNSVGQASSVPNSHDPEDPLELNAIENYYCARERGSPPGSRPQEPLNVSQIPRVSEEEMKKFYSK